MFGKSREGESIMWTQRRLVVSRTRWPAVLVVFAVGLIAGAGVAGARMPAALTERHIAYVSEARAVVPLNELVARNTATVAAAFFYVTPTGPSLRLRVDDAAYRDGETLSITVWADGEVVFDGCVPDGTRRTIGAAAPGREHTVVLGAGGGVTCDVAWPTVGVVSVAA